MSEDLQPWDLKPSDEREADTLRTFIIFCEDEHHERFYFQSFEQQVGGLKVNGIPNLRSKKLNLNATINECQNRGLIWFTQGTYQVLDGVNEHLWCVYDRDVEHADYAQVPAHNNIDFDTAIIAAENSGLKVAWSNDVFEMWLLLHFEQIPTGSMLHRTYVYDRLTDIFKNQVPKNPELNELTANAGFNYKDNMKRRDRFLKEVLPLLHPRTELAIANARVLEAHFNDAVPYHQRNPCTMVHHLVLEILDRNI
jgi:hypothetical protein